MFFTYSIFPVLTYGLVFLVLVGVDEMAKLSVITEGFASKLVINGVHLARGLA